MLLLTSTSDKVQVITDATADVEVHASYVDYASGTITPARTNTASITTATTTDVVASPGSSTQRNVKHLNVRNNHASTAVNVTVQHTDGTNVETLYKVNLTAGESLVFGADGIWRHYDANGGAYENPLPVATQSDMEAASSTLLLVTPGRQHYHPGHPKFWVKCGVTANILASYNVSSLTDTGAGLVTVNIGTDFSDANWCCQVTVERTSTSLTVTNLKFCNIRSGGQAAGTLLAEVYDGTATTAVQEDPTSWHIMGLGDQA